MTCIKVHKYYGEYFGGVEKGRSFNYFSRKGDKRSLGMWEGSVESKKLRAEFLGIVLNEEYVLAREGRLTINGDPTGDF